MNGHEQLQHVGVGRPRLRALAAPGAEQADAHLAVLVEVGVKPVGTVGVVVAGGRGLRVVARQLEVEEKDAVLVRGAPGALDQHRVQVLSRRETRSEQDSGLLSLNCIAPLPYALSP